MKAVYESPLFFLAGIGLFGYGAYKFVQTVVAPHVKNLIG